MAWPIAGPEHILDLMEAASGDPGMPPFGASDRAPDDARELEPDRLAWLAEQRALRRRRLLRRLMFARLWDRLGLSGPLVGLCLVTTTAVAALVIAAIPPSAPARPSKAPLAAAPFASVMPRRSPAAAVEPTGGPVIGHLLPPVQLDGDAGRPVSSTDLRPAVLALIPARCDCAEVIGDIYRQASEFRLDVWLIGVAGAADQLAGLDTSGARGGARWAVDGAGRLSTALAARGLTLVTVRPDGEIADLGRDLPLDTAALPALEPLLARLTASSR